MSSGANIVRTNARFGTFFSLEGDLVTDQLRRYAAPTRNELAMLKSLVVDGDNVVDVGAHIGVFCAAFSSFNAGRGKVFSFEANPGNYDLLRRNIMENHLEGVATPIHAVVSDRKTPFRMTLPGDTNTGEYCFLPDPESRDTSIPCVNIDEWHREHQSDTPVHFVKIDVEGAELSVLRSCLGLIQTYRPILYVEINGKALRRFDVLPGDIEALLEPFGYHYFRNIGRRNSDSDFFKMARLRNLEEGGEFFDVVAIHPASKRYPRRIRWRHGLARRAISGLRRRRRRARTRDAYHSPQTSDSR